ncbi:MAG: protein D1, partial [Olpidium bornovanus]
SCICGQLTRFLLSFCLGRATEAANQPVVTFSSSGPGTYTLVMTDPDAPSRKDPKFGEWRHWVVTDITGGDVKNGKILTSYHGPAPPAGSGKHRYVFLLFKQPEGVQFKPFPEERPHFKARDFMKQHNLSPIGATFFESENK